MTYNKIKYLFIIHFLITLFSCNPQKCEKFEIEVIDSHVDTSFGLGNFLVYASDTNWSEISHFSDSIFNSINNKNSCFIIISYRYPKESIPKFKRHNSFSITFPSNEKNYVIARYYDTSHIYPPVLVKYPENFKIAKESEIQKQK